MIEFIELMPWYIHVLLTVKLMVTGVVVKELFYYDKHQNKKYKVKGKWWLDRRDNLLLGLLLGMGLTVACAIPIAHLGWGDYYFMFALLTGYAGLEIIDKIKERGKKELD